MLDFFVSFVIIFLTYAIYIYLNNYRKYAHLPGPVPLPIVGNAHLLIKSNKHVSEVLVNVYMEMFEKYKEEGLFRLFLGPLGQVFLTSPKNIKALLSSNNLDKPPQLNAVKPLAGNGLFLFKSDKWRVRRKQMNQAFHLTILDQYIFTFNRISVETVSYLKDPKNMNYIAIREFMESFSLKLICETSMGYKLDSEQKMDADYLHSSEVLKKIIVQRVFNPLYSNEFFYKYFIGGKTYRHAAQVQIDFIKNIISQRKKVLENKDYRDELFHPKNNHRVRLSLLDLLLKMQMDEGSLTDEDILNEIQVVLFAGHDTLSAFFSFAFLTLGNRCDIQDKLRVEINENLDKNGTMNVSREDFVKLNYLDAFMKEILRIYTVTALPRELNEDLVLEKYTIPKGTTTFVVFYALHRDPNIYPEPEKCIPERFLKNKEELDMWAFLPFSGGIRNCIGLKYAQFQIKVFLSHIIRNFRIESLEKIEEIEIVNDATLNTKKPIHIKFVPIN